MEVFDQARLRQSGHERAMASKPKFLGCKFCEIERFPYSDDGQQPGCYRLLLKRPSGSNCGHPMISVRASGGTKMFSRVRCDDHCDQCYSKIPSGDSAWNCQPCKKLFCLSCSKSGSLWAQAGCEHGGLKWAAVPGEKCKCDSCRESIPKGSVALSCRRCDKDYCKECFKTRHTRDILDQNDPERCDSTICCNCATKAGWKSGDTYGCQQCKDRRGRQEQEAARRRKLKEEEEAKVRRQQEEAAAVAKKLKEQEAARMQRLQEEASRRRKLAEEEMARKKHTTFCSSCNIERELCTKDPNKCSLFGPSKKSHKACSHGFKWVMATAANELCNECWSQIQKDSEVLACLECKSFFCAKCVKKGENEISCCNCGLKNGYLPFKASDWYYRSCQQCRDRNSIFNKGMEARMSPRVITWVMQIKLSEDNQTSLLSALINNEYSSIDVLQEENPQTFVELPETQNLKPGAKIVVKSAITALQHT